MCSRVDGEVALFNRGDEVVLRMSELTSLEDFDLLCFLGEGLMGGAVDVSLEGSWGERMEGERRDLISMISPGWEGGGVPAATCLGLCNVAHLNLTWQH